MQHKLINTGDYLLIVDDKTLTDMPNNINVYSVRYNKPIRFAETENSYMNECFEIKAHLPLNNSPILEGVDLLPPLEDEVEKLAKEEIERYRLSSSSIDKPREVQRFNGFKTGYNKAKEKYKYTEEDMRKVIDKTIHACNKAQKESYGELVIDEDEIIQSLQQPKMPVGFKCKTIDEAIRNFDEDINGTNAFRYEPKLKTTTNSQGITQWVGEYIY